MLFNHSHGNLFNIGKSELLDGCPYMLPRGYAYDLAMLGIASLSIDQMCFEARRGRTESATYKEMLWDGHYMWAWMVFDSLRALDYLCAREDVDAERIGTVGMSMGSSMAQWVAALDERIRTCVDICCLTNFDELAAERRFDEHGIYYYIPGLRRKFTTSQLNALIAPRAHLTSIIEHSSRINTSPLSGLSSFTLYPLTGWYSSRRWIVFASIPLASDMRFAARPVGAARMISKPLALYTFMMLFVVVVFPVPGPPVNTIAFDDTAQWIACSWTSSY